MQEPCKNMLRHCIRSSDVDKMARFLTEKVLLSLFLSLIYSTIIKIVNCKQEKQFLNHIAFNVGKLKAENHNTFMVNSHINSVIYKRLNEITFAITLMMTKKLDMIFHEEFIRILVFHIESRGNLLEKELLNTVSYKNIEKKVKEEINKIIEINVDENRRSLKTTFSNLYEQVSIFVIGIFFSFFGIISSFFEILLMKEEKKGVTTELSVNAVVPLLETVSMDITN